MPLFTALPFCTPKSVENLKIFSINSWKSAQSMFYIRLMCLHQTTEWYYNTPFDVSEQSHAMRLGEWSHSGKVTWRAGCCWLNETAFLLVLYKIYFVWTSDVTTVSNDKGNILQTLCKTSLKKTILLCCANAWIGTCAMFPVIPKWYCCFSVVQSFQFEITTYMTYLQGKHSQSVDRKFSYHECWCYIISIKLFSTYKLVIVTPCAGIKQFIVCTGAVGELKKLKIQKEIPFFKIHKVPFYHLGHNPAAIQISL